MSGYFRNSETRNSGYSGISNRNFRKSPDFSGINRIALSIFPEFLDEWLPGGKYAGEEYIVRNPTRYDRNPGSFRINSVSGKWADFATGDKGGDIISLYAYLNDFSQIEAALRLGRLLGVCHD